MKCHDCNGSGIRYFGIFMMCTSCNGTGEIGSTDEDNHGC